MAPTYKQLAKCRHPEYDKPYWDRLRALYAGGKSMGLDRGQSSRDILRKLLPPHNDEEQEVYDKRLDTAAYVNYFGEIVDYIAASIAASPVTFKYEPETVDPFYGEFYQDVTDPDSRKMSLNQHLRKTLVNALICRDSWTLIDLPSRDENVEIRSKAEEEAYGLLEAYACVLDAEQVVDWEYDQDGDELEWISVCSVSARRESIDQERNVIHEQYTIYDKQGWQKWGFTYKLDRQGTPDLPQDGVEAEDEGSGKHSFGCVPVVRFCLPEGLWAGNKIACLAEAHFNKRSAFDWNQRNTLFQFLAVHLSEVDPLNPVTEDQARVEKQKVGPGRFMKLAGKDLIKYVSPEAPPFQIALEDMKDLRDEMHRVMHHMALSVENSASTLKRSADSKKQDNSATAVVLKGLGELLREHAEEMIEMVARGRGEYDTFEVEAQGADEFDDQSLGDLLQEAAIVHMQLKPKSAAFLRSYDLKWMKRSLGTDLTDEIVEEMKDDLESNVTNEDVMAAANPVGLLPGENMLQKPQEAPPEKAPAKKRGKKAKEE